jgi:hypothetical protein
VLQALRRNFGLKLFAFALALGGWAYFRFLAGPSITAPFEERIGLGRGGGDFVNQTVPLDVAYVGTRDDLVVAKLAITPSRVALRAPASDLQRIRAVRVVVPFPSDAATFDAMVRPEISAPGLDPSAIVISPNLVRVRVVFVRAHAALGKEQG